MTRNDRTNNRWTMVYRELRADILSGALAPGSTLPTLSELARQQDLTAHGARRVMDRLRDQGLVQGWQGKGYSVALPRLRLKISERKPVFGDRVRELGFSCESQVVAARIKTAPRSIASRLGCRTRTKTLATETVRKVGGRALAVSFDYFVQDRLFGLDTALRETGSVSKALAEHGIETYERQRTSLQSRLPTAHEALLLDIPRHQPVYETIGTNLDEDGIISQVSKGVWRADCVTYEF